MEAENPNPSPPWLELPADVTANILHRLGAVEILETAQKVCTQWRSLCKDPSMWRVIDARHPEFPNHDPSRLEMISRHAVDLSQGQVIDVTVENLCPCGFLMYIGERCNLLKRLRVVADCYTAMKCFTEAVKNFPDLEELHLPLIQDLYHPEDIEKIGTSCPKLKSFTYDHSGFFCPTPDPYMEFDGDDMEFDSNGNALAVARSMPNLCHLGLLYDGMNNEGLEAILNSCPHLESLDIHGCFSVDLSGDLGKRCSQKLKLLRPPLDSSGDSS